MTISTGTDRFTGLDRFSNTGLRIKLLVQSGSKGGEVELMSGNLVHLVANVWGERFGEEEVTRSDETTASELEENDLFFELDGSQEKVADLEPDVSQVALGLVGVCHTAD